MKVCVVGLGWMGLPIAALLAEGGNEVSGLDIDQELVDRINKLDIDRNEAELLELLKSNPIKASTKPEDVLPGSDAIVVIVPLITKDDKSIGYEVMDKAMETISQHMKDNALIVVETTMPIGACRNKVAPILEKSDKKFLLAYAPIRAMSGSALDDMREKYPRVLGALDDASLAKAEELLKTFFKNDIIKLSLEEAEASKIYEVVYRDVNIALANELGLISEELGLDYMKIKEAANSCGYYHLHDVGIGVGGHCLPVYPYLLLSEVKENYGLIHKAREINDFMPKHTADVVKKQNPKSVTIYGIAYRPETNECRFSPAIEIAGLLKDYNVKVCDPYVNNETLSQWGEPVSIEDGLNSDVLVFTVAHSAFDGIENKIPDKAVVIDGRRVLDEAKVKGKYIAIGKGHD